MYACAGNLWQHCGWLEEIFMDTINICSFLLEGLTLEDIRGKVKSSPSPSIFLALNFYLTDYQKLWHNSSLFINTSFDAN